MFYTCTSGIDYHTMLILSMDFICFCKYKNIHYIPVHNKQVYMTGKFSDLGLLV